MRLNPSIGMVALSAWLILTGLASFGFSFTNEGVVLALLAIIAGILIMLGR